MINATATVVDFSVDTPAEFTNIDDLVLERGTRGWCVQAGVSHGLWVLDKESVAQPNGTTIIATQSGVGNWTGPVGGGGGAVSIEGATTTLISDEVIVPNVPLTIPAVAITTTAPAERIQVTFTMSGCADTPGPGLPASLLAQLFLQTNGAPAFPGAPLTPSGGTGTTSQHATDTQSCAFSKIFIVPPGVHNFNMILSTDNPFRIFAASNPAHHALITVVRLGA